MTAAGFDGSDDELEVLDGVEEEMNHAPAGPGGAGGDDELEIVGTKGHNALSDFPHSREVCSRRRHAVAATAASYPFIRPRLRPTPPHPTSLHATPSHPPSPAFRTA